MNGKREKWLLSRCATGGGAKFCVSIERKYWNEGQGLPERFSANGRGVLRTMYRNNERTILCENSSTNLNLPGLIVDINIVGICIR